MADIEKIVVVTKKTQLDGLIAQFNTKAQANFYINQMGGDFKYYEDSHSQYNASLNYLKKVVPTNYKIQVIDQEFLPNFLFNRTDLIVIIGPDGLVVNTAKYLDNQYILAVNPDPQRIEGILLPFRVEDIREQLKILENGQEQHIEITMAQAKLNNGQVLYGVNDLFIGHHSHQSARYSVEFNGKIENHSSSGIIISTGCGSTGWFKSIVTGAVAITKAFKHTDGIEIPSENEYRFNWDAKYLYFSVREPWISKTSSGKIVFGQIKAGNTFTITSNMPDGGVIFSDGIESDFVNFNSGAIAKISVAGKTANLLVKEKPAQHIPSREDYY